MTTESKTPKTSKTQTWVTLRDAADKTGLSLMWLRNLVKKDRVTARMTKIPGTDIPRREVVLEDVEATMTGTKSRRSDGRGKWTIYLNDQELTKVREFINKELPSVILKRANPTKADKAKAKAVSAKAKAD